VCSAEWRRDMANSSFSVSIYIQRRTFDTASPVILCHEGVPTPWMSRWVPAFYFLVCFQILVVRGLALRGV